MMCHRMCLRASFALGVPARSRGINDVSVGTVHCMYCTLQETIEEAAQAISFRIQGLYRIRPCAEKSGSWKCSFDLYTSWQRPRERRSTSSRNDQMSKSGEYVNVNSALQLVADGAVEGVVVSKNNGYNVAVRILERVSSGFTHGQQSEQQKCSWTLGKRART